VDVVALPHGNVVEALVGDDWAVWAVMRDRSGVWWCWTCPTPLACEHVAAAAAAVKWPVPGPVYGRW